LPFDSDGFLSRFGRTGFVDHTDRLWVGLFGDNQLAAASEHFVMVPVDRIEKSLERSRCDTLLQSDRFDILASEFRQQTTDICGEEPSAFDAVETIGEESEKLGEHLSERCDILERH